MIKYEGLDKLNKGLNKLVKQLTQPRATFKKISIVMFKDVMEHFNREEGPSGKWLKFLNPKTGQRQDIRPYGRGGNKLLQDTGRLKNSIISISTNEGAEVGTNVVYAPTHQFGNKNRNIPQRMFLWLSEKAETEIIKVFMKDLEMSIKWL